MSTYTVEMYWRCPTCQANCPGMTGVERDSLRCVNCGYEKQEFDAWLMPEHPEEQKHLEGDLDRKARAGANWTCTFCQKESRARSRICETCGAARDSPTADSPEEAKVELDFDPFFEQLRKSKDPLRATSEEPLEPTDAASQNYRTPAFKPPPPPPHVRRLSPLGMALMAPIGLAVVATVCSLVVWASPRETTAVVDGLSWTRAEVLTERRDYNGEDWQDEEPNDVFDQTCETRSHGTHDCHAHDCNCHAQSYDCRCSGGDSYDCHCHTSCRSNRNGSATCSQACDTCSTPRVCSTCTRTVCDTCYDQCPTYAQWCRFRYHQWDVIEREQAEGDDTNPLWPVLRYQTDNPLQRLQRTESFRVHWHAVEDPTRTWSETYPLSTFQTLHRGDRWQVRWSPLGLFRLVKRI